ncbi:MAG: metallophosphoesterase, partial [Acidobacteria bacterium]|nr:metallophosphoesterase [Acidobacteriota bacterium]
MEKETRRVRRPGSVCTGVAWLALLLAAAPVTCGQESAERVALTILATTDVHGNVWPYDYLQGQGAERGLAKVSAYVRQVRARQPNTLLVDCGDTFQGTPLAYLAAEKHAEEPNPVVAAMNAMGYDAMAIGNHEWNFGLHTLWRLKEEAQFPILGANVASTYHDRLRDFKPYVIRRVGGVRVALLGLVTPSIPRWDPPEHLVGYEFRDPVEVASKLVPQLRRKADVIVVLIHSGLGRDPETGAPVENVYPEENHVWDLAEQVPGIDVIFFGHSHRELAGKVMNGALLVQPKNWARSVAEVELTLARDNQGWRVVDRQSRLVPMDASIPAEYILFQHYMGEVDDVISAKLANYLRDTQGEDGGWPLFHAGESDISATVKVYYALKMVGDDPEAAHMRKARAAVLARGGAARSNVLTRITLALFGQVPWRAVPVMPVEIMLLPKWFPFHMNKISYWSRTTIAPLLILMALKPQARNPRGIGIPELFVKPPETETRYNTNPTGGLWGTLFFGIDRVLQKIERFFPKWTRNKGIQATLDFIRPRLNGEHGIAALFPPMIY